MSDSIVCYILFGVYVFFTTYCIGIYFKTKGFGVNHGKQMDQSRYPRTFNSLFHRYRVLLEHL